jgi:hypothetical protein
MVEKEVFKAEQMCYFGQSANLPQLLRPWKEVLCSIN